MKCYLAGGISGNLKPAWKELVKSHEITMDRFVEALTVQIYLAGGNSKEKIIRTYLAETAPWRDEAIYDPIIRTHHPYMLESYYYVDDDTAKLLPLFGDFMLDSGAFTFMQGKSGKTEWEEYIDHYADYIRKHNIKKYFELDIDSVVGYDKVKEFRKRLESAVGWSSIPVWHTSRGIKEYKKMCKEYGYVAIGGIVSKEITRDMYKAFPAMIEEAHKNGTKVHGLGFTNLGLLPHMHFDSVDSTAWLAGNRYGYVYYFDGKTMKKCDSPVGHRLADSRRVAIHNYTEWIKFQKYAEVNL